MGRLFSLRLPCGVGRRRSTWTAASPRARLRAAAASSMIDDPSEPTAKGGMMAEQTVEVLGTFFGDETFPIDWREGEDELFWIFDDLHIPNPVSPMFFDIGGWWLTCDHM